MITIANIAYREPISTIPPSSSRGSAGLQEDEFVTAETARASLQLHQGESVGPKKIENFFRLGHFERIATNPINDIAPGGHSSTSLIMPPSTERAPTQQVKDHP